MILSYRRILAVLAKELTQLKRDRTTFALILMFPIMQLLLFGYAINTDPKHLPTAVVSRDNGIFSRTIITGLQNSEYFDVNLDIASDTEAKTLLKKGLTQFVITIPENFTRDIIKGISPELLLEADATDPTATAGAVGALDGIISASLSKDLEGTLEISNAKGEPIKLKVHKKYNPEGFSRYNIVPGLMGIILTMTGIIMTALALTREQERGTMENLLAMPVTPLEVMAGKITPYVVIGYVQSFIIIVVAKFLFNVPILGNLFLLSAVLIVFITCNLALGFSISAMARNQLQAMQIAMMFIMPSILLSGFMFPFRGMPLWAQVIGSCIPTTYFIRIVRGILLKGSGFFEIWHSLWPLFIFMAVISAIAMRFYRNTLD